MAHFLAPHNLDQQFISNILSFFNRGDVSIIDSPEKVEEEYINKVNILTYKGHLLETYTKFKLCYVGGGFERSIHSVLEPYLSNCYVLCGASRLSVVLSFRLLRRLIQLLLNQLIVLRVLVQVFMILLKWAKEI